MKHLIKLLTLSLLATLIIIAAPAASAGFVSDFSGLEFREAAGFYTVIVDLSGTEYRFDGILDISDLEQQPEILSIASYHIYYEDTAVMDVTLREMEPAESDPDITSSTGIVLTNGYYAVSFDINDEYEAFLTGLTLDSLQAVQLELINSVITGTGFNMEHLDFIDTEKIEWGEGENKDLCWAASCSNILHYTGWAQKADLATPDDVFEVYIDAFSPAGGNAVYGIPWFFSGINEKQGEADWAQVDNTEKYAYGQFNGFLPEYAVDNFFTGYYMRTAPRDIEKAFAELRDGAGVSIAFGWYTPTWARNGGHAITLWGYIQKKNASGFDKNDYYALIVSDSDSDDQYDERRDAPNELWMLPLTSVVTAQGYDSWTMEGYNTNLYALLENFYALVPYSDECVREESVPGNRFDENAVDISAYIQILNSDNETDVFAAGDSVTLRFGCKNLSPLDWTEARTVTISYTLTDQHGEIVMNNSTEWTNTLNAGTILSARTTAKLPAGEYTFTVAVSLKDSAAAETYYSNNMLERHFTVLPEPELTLSALQNEDAFTLSYESEDTLQVYDLYELSVAYLQNDVWSDWLTVYVGRTLPESCAVSPTGTQIKFRLEAEVGGVLSHSWESEPLLLESDGTHVLADGGDLRALLQSDAVKDGDIILLQGTANVNDTNSDSAPWVIDKAVTIQGGILCSRSGGIILGANVTLDGVTLMLPNDIRNAIFANGYTLTLKNVTADRTANIVHLFGGTLTGHAVTARSGEHSTINLSGQIDLGGNVYAGNMSSDGAASTWDLPVTILVDENTTGSVMLLRGCGAMEAPVDPNQMLNPDYQPDHPAADHTRFPVTGKVTLSLWQRVVQTVYGSTGGEENVDVIYNGTDNACQIILSDVNHLTVESGCLAFNPWLLNSTTALTIADEAVVDLAANSGNLYVLALDGTGTLILGEETCLNIAGAVNGTTKVAIGGIYEGTSTGTIDHSFTYISAPNSLEDSFLLLTPEDDPELKLVRNENGDWTIPATVYAVIVSTITAPETIAAESGCYFINIPFTVEFASDPAFSYMDAVPVSISVNGIAAEMIFDEEYGYHYYVFPEGTELGEAFFFTDENEILQLLPIGDGVIPDGEYIITVTVPGENMASGEDVTLTTVVTVGENEPEPDPNVIASGTCGENLAWTLDVNGVLTVSGEGAMWNNPSWNDHEREISKVVIGDGVTRIGERAFWLCDKLETIEISGSVTSIDFYAIDQCKGLKNIFVDERNVIFADADGVLFDKSFKMLLCYPACREGTSYSIPEGVTLIANYAFSNCSNLLELEIPASVTNGHGTVFAGSISLVHIIVDAENPFYSSVDGVLFSKDQSVLFYHPAGREETEYTIPETVATISAHAFNRNVNLTGITIPAGMKNIGYCSFEGCTALKTVTYKGTETQWEEIVIDRNNECLQNAKLVCTGVLNAVSVTLEIDPNTGLPVLTWDAIQGTEKYEIWCMTDEGFFVLLDEIVGTEYCDTGYAAGAAHFYMVRAVSGDTEGEFSDIVVLFELRRSFGVPPRP